MNKRLMVFALATTVATAAILWMQIRQSRVWQLEHVPPSGESEAESPVGNRVSVRTQPSLTVLSGPSMGVHRPSRGAKDSPVESQVVIVGACVGASGEPLSGLSVQLCRIAQDSELSEAKTDAKGGFELHAGSDSALAFDGTRLELRIRGDGLASVNLPLPGALPAGLTDLGTICVLRGTEVTLRFFGESSVFESPIMIDWEVRPSVPSTCSYLAKGSYDLAPGVRSAQLGRLPSGSFTALVSCHKRSMHVPDGLPMFVNADVDHQDIQIRVDPEPATRIRVERDDGVPVSSPVFTMIKGRAPSARFVELVAHRRSEIGEFDLHVASPLRFPIRVDAPGCRPSYVPFSLVTKKTEVQTIVLQRGKDSLLVTLDERDGPVLRPADQLLVGVMRGNAMDVPALHPLTLERAESIDVPLRMGITNGCRVFVATIDKMYFGVSEPVQLSEQERGSPEVMVQFQRCVSQVIHVGDELGPVAKAKVVAYQSSSRVAPHQSRELGPVSVSASGDIPHAKPFRGTQTDDRGYAVVELPAGFRFRLEVQTPAHAPRTLAGLSIPHSGPLNIELAPSSGFEVRLVGQQVADSASRVNFGVFAVAQDPGRRIYAGTSQQRGVWSFRGLKRGSYFVGTRELVDMARALVPGDATLLARTSCAKIVQVKHGEFVSVELDVRQSGLGQIAGTIKRLDGKLGLRVSVVPLGAVSVSTFTSFPVLSDGAFRVGPVSAGEYWLRVVSSASRFLPIAHIPVRVVAGNSSHVDAVVQVATIQFHHAGEAGRQISVRVLNRQGKSVSIFSLRHQISIAKELEPGVYTLQVSERDGEVATLSMNAPPGYSEVTIAPP